MSDYPMLISNKLHSFRNFDFTNIQNKKSFSKSIRPNKRTADNYYADCVYRKSRIYLVHYQSLRFQYQLS